MSSAVSIDVSSGGFHIGFSCKACGMQWSRGCVDDAPSAEAVIAMAKGIAFTHRETQSFGDRHWCSQCPQEERLIDGKTPAECLAKYEAWQREDSGSRMKRMRDGYLTREQMLAAQAQWSAELRKRQREQLERERCAVVCDLQDEP